MGLFDRLFGRKKEEPHTEPVQPEGAAEESSQAADQGAEAETLAQTSADFYENLEERLAQDQVLNEVIEEKIQEGALQTAEEELTEQGPASDNSSEPAAEEETAVPEQEGGAETEQEESSDLESTNSFEAASESETAAPAENAAEPHQEDQALADEPAAEQDENLSAPASAEEQSAPVAAESRDYYQELQDRLAAAREQVSRSNEAVSSQSQANTSEAKEAAAQRSEQSNQPQAQAESVQEKYDRSLKKTRTGFGARLNAFFANFRSVDEDFFEELEELLITSDVGVQVASNLTEDLRYEARLENAKKPDALRQLIIEKLVDIYEKDGRFNEQINLQPGLTVMLFVGVNGVGKTTSIGKLAYKYKQEGKKVMLVAADTFRAGAVAQLAEWGRRVDVPVVTGPEKSDPASVVFDGMERAQSENIDILMIDTAGRLQNKDNLMAELEKIGRIIKRVDPSAPHETFLALDASTGQNALVQAKEFSKITPVSGIVLTKIDGTARGGVVLAIRQELDIPVKLIGFGENIDDIGEFNSENFMRGLLEGLV